MTATAPQRSDSRASLVPPDEKFWQRYSPHHEFPVSSLTSVALHVLVLVLLMVVAWVIVTLGLTAQDEPIPADAVTLAGPVRGTDGPQGPGDQPAPLAPHRENNDPDRPTAAPTPVVEPPTLPDVPKPQNDPVEPRPRPGDTRPWLGRVDQVDKDIRDIREKLGQGARVGDAPAGPGPGSSPPGGGQGQRQRDREKRILRWTMVFTTNNGDDYARQLQSLGATLAVPDPKKEGQWLLIDNLTRRPVRPVVKDLSGVKQIYWIDNRPDSVKPLARALGLDPTPTAVVAFFPDKLERKLLDLELKYSGKPVAEDDIDETRFDIVRDGDGYAPRVASQQMKPKK